MKLFNRRKKFVKKLNRLVQNWKDLSDIWLELDDETNFALESKYPFNECFDVLEKKLVQWKNSVESEIKKIENEK